MAASGVYAQKEKYDKPNAVANVKDPELAPEEMLAVDKGIMNQAKNKETMAKIGIRFIEDGADRTLDSDTQFKKNMTIESVSAQQTVLELRHRIAEEASLEMKDINLYVANASIPDNIRIGELQTEWQGFGLEDWPPKFICKPKIRGFEVFVDCFASRDTSVWEKGRMTTYCDRHFVFDVETASTVLNLKELLQAKIRMPAARQKLSALMRTSNRDWGEYVELSDDSKTLSDYQIDKYCVKINVEKQNFDANGNFVFTDAYWDSEGYHPPALDSYVNPDSIADRNRPDAPDVDPRQPSTMIVSDRWAAKAE